MVRSVILKCMTKYSSNPVSDLAATLCTSV
jgi:hypothetical protein